MPLKSRPWQQISLEVVGLCKKCCISDEVDGMEDEEEVGYAGNEHETR
jgi:hypothetical protein